MIGTVLSVIAFFVIFLLAGSWLESKNKVKSMIGSSVFLVLCIFFGFIGLILLMGFAIELAKAIPYFVRFGVAGVVAFFVFRFLACRIYGEGSWRFIAGVTNDLNGETEGWRRKIGEKARWLAMVGIVVFGLVQWGLGELMEAMMDDAALRFFEMGKYERVEE